MYDDTNRKHGAEDEPVEDVPTSTLIGGNLAGGAAGSWPGGVSAEASTGYEVEKMGAGRQTDEQEDMEPVNMDALSEFWTSETQGRDQNQPAEDTEKE